MVVDASTSADPRTGLDRARQGPAAATAAQSRTRIQVLIVEDRPADAELMVKELTKAGYDVDWQRVDGEQAFRRRLTPRLDAIITDYNVPGFGALPAIRALSETGLDVPIIVCSGTIGDEKAAECLKLGATDYVLKDRLARLGHATRRALAERETRRQKAEALAALERSEEKIRTVLGTVEDVVWSLSLTDWKITYMNPAGQKMFGRPIEDFYQDGQLWLESVHPGDRQAMLDLQQSMIKWGTDEGEMRIVRPDGSLRHVLVRAWCANDAQGKPLRLEGICTDITERKQAEADLRRQHAALEEAQRLAHVGSWEWDAVADKATLSTEGWRIWGLPPRTAPGTAYFMASVDAQDRPAFEAALQDAVSAGKDYDVTARLATPEGPKWTRHRGHVMERDPDGRPRLLNGTVEDITDRVRAEEQRVALEVSKQEGVRLEQLSQFKSSFLNMVAHDLNNVVTPLRISAGTLMGKEKAGGEASRAVQILHRSVERLAGFLADLLDAARLQSGRLNVNPEDLDLSAHLAASVEAARPEAAAAGITLEVALQPGVRIWAEPRRVEQVTTNLLGNALKFTASGGRVWLTLQSSGSQAEFRVADDGPGLRAEDIGKLFQPFSQIGAQAQGKHTGTGLGLFICKGIVEAHGGTIHAESAGAGKGAQFIVRLPVAGPAAEGHAP